MRTLKLAIAIPAILCVSAGSALASSGARAESSRPPALAASTSHSPSSNASSIAPVLHRRDARYRLYPSDELAITFPLTPEFNQTLTIEPDGYASLSGAGDVRLAGLTTKEAAATIKVAYKKILHDPIVTIELKNFNKPFFVVTGQVNHPGKYDLRGPTSATEAVAIAGGMTGSAKASQALLFRRADGSRYEITRVNLKRILAGREQEDTELLPGDMLYVPAVSHLQERDPESLPAIYRESYRLLFFLGVPTFAGLTVLSPLVSRIWIGHYEPVFVEFVVLLAAAWLVNILSNPAYVLDLGTGALRWVTIGCLATAALNASLGFIAGYYLGGMAVVAASAFSLACGYTLVISAYHLQNRLPFAVLLPPESRSILVSSAICASVLLPLLLFLRAHSGWSPAPIFVVAASLMLQLIPIWRHPLRKRLLRWAFSRSLAATRAETL